MSIDNFLKNFKSFHNYVEATSYQFRLSQKELNEDFHTWLKESSEKIKFCIRNQENCSIDLFVPKPSKTHVFKDLSNIVVTEISEFDKELEKLRKFVSKRDRKRKKIFSEEFNSTYKLEHITYNKLFEEKKEFHESQDSLFSSQVTRPSLSKLKHNIITKKKLDKISEEKAEDISKNGMNNSVGRVSEINMILPPQNDILYIQEEKVNKEIDVILENFDVDKNTDKENYKNLIQSLKKDLDLNENEEKKRNIDKNSDCLSLNNNKSPILSLNKKFDFKNLKSFNKEKGNIFFKYSRKN